MSTESISIGDRPTNDTDVILPHEEDPEELSCLAAEAVDNCRYWNRRAIDLAGKDRIQADRMALWAAQWSTKEAEILRRLNAHMICTGTMPGGRRTIAGHVWMAVRADGLAVHLGAELPLDDVESDREAMAEREADYRASVSYIGR